MSAQNELPPVLQPSTSWDRTPVEYDEADFHRAIMMYKHKVYRLSTSSPSAQLSLDKIMHEGLLLPPGGEGFVRKKPLLPLWVDFITTVWQPMYKGPKVEPLNFSNPSITSSRAADFLKWLNPRRTYNVDEAGHPADGTHWWPRDVCGIIAAVGDEHRTKLRAEEEEDEASRRRRAELPLRGMPPLERLKVLDWRKGVEMVGWEDGMLLGMVSKEHDTRAPLAEVLRRPASDFDEAQEQQQQRQQLVVEDLRLGPEASYANGQRGTAAPLTLREGEGESSIQAGGANERRVPSQRDDFGQMVLQAMAQSVRALAREQHRIEAEESRQHQHQPR